MRNLGKLTKKRLGEILVEEGYITEEQLLEALDFQKKSDSGMILGEVLIDRGYVSERGIARAIATQFHLPFLTLQNHAVNKDMSSLLPTQMLHRYQFVPLDRFANVITILMSGVLSADIITEIQELTGCELFVFIGTSRDVKMALNEFSPLDEVAAPKKDASSEDAPTDDSGDSGDWGSMFDDADEQIHSELDR